MLTAPVAKKNSMRQLKVKSNWRLGRLSQVVVSVTLAMRSDVQVAHSWVSQPSNPAIKSSFKTLALDNPPNQAKPSN